jgi:putative aminophosphonate oxidoreductase
MSAIARHSRKVANLNRALWMEDQLAVEHDHPTPPLEGSTTLDVCIVGGGLTGLWTALRIRELDPSCSVGVIEADICGSGASGSNGGFAMTWWPKIATLKKLMGSDDAIRMARDSEAAVADMGRFCHEHAIGADFKSAGWLWAATNEVQLGSWDETLKVLDAMGARPFERVSADEAVSMSGSDRHLGGVYESGVATVQPAALVRGLRAVALRQGVSVWEHSPMTSFESAHDNVTITTPRGAVRAKKLVLATNAWLATYPQVRRHLMVLGSEVVATDRAPELLRGEQWPGGLAISDSRRLVHYYRTTSDGRIVFGKGGGRIAFRGRQDRSTWSRPARASFVKDQLLRTYPQFAGVPITHSWAGAVDYAVDSLPFFGKLDDDSKVTFGVGFSGNGVGPSLVGGRILASLALDRDDEWSQSPLIRTPKGVLPPEPFRFVGGVMVRGAIRRKEVEEDRGHRSRLTDRFLAGLDPTGFVG